MDKYILVFGLFFSSFLALGQENRMSFGLAGSVDKYNFDFQPFAGINQKQTNDLSYSFGLRFQYGLNDKMLLRSGVFYSEKGYKTDYLWGPLVDPGDPYLPVESNLKLYYLNVPIMIGYNIINKAKFKLAPSTGIISEFLIGNTETSVFGDNSERASAFLNENLSAVLLSVQANIAFEYHFARNAFLTFEPYMRYGFNKIDGRVMSSKPMSYGVSLSINYKGIFR